MIRVMETNNRSGIVAVVGRANVGKSTLVNGILGEKIAIVSPVAQTTRNLIRGVLTEERGQVVLIDTPGIHRAEGNLGKLLNQKARGSLEGSDAVMLVLDRALTPRIEDDGWMRRLLFSEEPVVFVLNKADRVKNCEDMYRQLWETIQKEKGKTVGVTWITVSAMSGDGVPELVQHLFDQMPVGPHLFADDLLTDYPRKLAIGDCIREGFFRCLDEELPHAIAVRVDELDEQEERWDVQATVYVNKPSQKPIVIGKKGRLLDRVRKQAEKELSETYGCRVSLHLWVKVEKKWIDNFWILKQLDLA